MLIVSPGWQHGDDLTVNTPRIIHDVVRNAIPVQLFGGDQIQHGTVRVYITDMAVEGLHVEYVLQRAPVRCRARSRMQPSTAASAADLAASGSNRRAKVNPGSPIGRYQHGQI